MKILKVTKENEQYYSLDFIRGYNLGATQQAEIMPERKKGKWIFHETENDRYDDMICPFCKTTYTVDAYRIDDIGFTAEDFNYCPSCGADMRGERDG